MYHVSAPGSSIDERSAQPNGHSEQYVNNKTTWFLTLPKKARVFTNYDQTLNPVSHSSTTFLHGYDRIYRACGGLYQTKGNERLLHQISDSAHLWLRFGTLLNFWVLHTAECAVSTFWADSHQRFLAAPTPCCDESGGWRKWGDTYVLHSCYAYFHVKLNVWAWTAIIIDFSVQIVSDKFKGKVRKALTWAKFLGFISVAHTTRGCATEHNATTPDDLLRPVRRAISGLACLDN